MAVKTKTTKSQYKSILKGEAKFELDEATKKVFADFIKKAKKRKHNPSKHSGTIICGPEEFAETKRQTTKVKFKK